MSDEYLMPGSGHHVEKKSTMTKAELTGYLVSLHTLIEAQTKGVVSIPSKHLGEEYERSWAKLKQMIQKEQEDEARNRNEQTRRTETRTDLSRGVSGGSVADWGSRRDLPSD